MIVSLSLPSLPRVGWAQLPLPLISGAGALEGPMECLR